MQVHGARAKRLQYVYYKLQCSSDSNKLRGERLRRQRQQLLLLLLPMAALVCLFGTQLKQHFCNGMRVAEYPFLRPWATPLLLRHHRLDLEQRLSLGLFSQTGALI